MWKVRITTLVTIKLCRTAVLFPVHAIDIAHKLAFCLPSFDQLVVGFGIILACIDNRIAVLVKIGIVIIRMENVTAFILDIFFVQDVPLLVIRTDVMVDKEIDTCSKEVFGRFLEEVI